MDRIEVFQILGIEETKDEKLIKAAYRTKLAVTNPEDDPEGFKRLRGAYEEACRLAGSKDVPKAAPQRDTTPSGLWLERAAEIYGNIRTRQDLKLWEELFDDDCFVSLEDEENCRFKLLRFLMEHFKLPTDVWKLLDRKLSIVSDAAGLRERFPADFVRYIQNKCVRGEDVEFSQFEGPQDGDYDLFLRYYDSTWQALAEGKLQEASRFIECADKLQIRHPVLEICRGDLLNRQGKKQEAIALMEELSKKYPKDAMIGYNTAEILWAQGHAENDRYREKAVEIYKELKESNDSHYMANVRLAEWNYEKGLYKEAKQCAEKVLTSGADDNFMKLLGKINEKIEAKLEKEYREKGAGGENCRAQNWETALELCWCYLQDGKIARGILMADQIKDVIPPEKEAEYRGLLAKLFVEEADYEDSVAMTRVWEEALRKRLESDEAEDEKKKDRDRLQQAHRIRMQCFYSLGLKDSRHFAEAVREGEAVLNGGMEDIGVLLELAQIYTEMGEYEKCLELVRKLVEEYQVYAAYAASLETYKRELDAAGVVRSSAQCLKYFPNFTKAYEYVAKVYLDLERREDLLKVFEDAGKHGVKSDILDAYRYQMDRKPIEMSVLRHKLNLFRGKYREPVEKGETFLYEEGLKVLTEYLYHYPDSYMFVERGLYHRAAHHYEEAKRDFEKAAALDPANPYAYNGLSFTYKYMGDYEKALVCIKKAILYMDRDMSPSIYADMGRLYLLLGDSERALASYLRYEELTKGKQRSLKSMEELAECRLRMGQVDEADELFWQIYPQDIWKRYSRRVDLYARCGEEKRCRELLEAWRKELKLERDDPVTRYFRWVNTNQYTKYYSDYFTAAAWAELLFGTKKKALKLFDDLIRFNQDQDRELDLLGEAVMGCILCGAERRGRKYASRLEKLLKKESFKAHDPYYNSAKWKLMMEIRSLFFSKDFSRLEQLLDRETATECCHSCSEPYCKELEALRVLWMIRQGRRDEARERLAVNLDIFPQDEYMQAIKHTVFDDQI